MINIEKLGGIKVINTYMSPHIDRSKWGIGPWDDEPDKIQFVDEDTGLPCLIHRNWSGALCGYVGVSEGHPFFGVHYGSLVPGIGHPDSILRVHGGITYSNFCDEGGEECHGVCHVPQEGEPDHIWWFGFDCSHCEDYSPGLEWGSPYQYREALYVAVEIQELAEQLKDLELDANI